MPARVIVLMGVSGSGKSTIATLLADQLHWQLAEGDELHSHANIDKMSHGVPLQDADRWPWLRAVAAVIDRWRASGEAGIITCSALKRAYRRIVIGDRCDVRLVYLRGSHQLLLQRLQARRGHFMPPELLDSQLRTLEEPAPEEHTIVIGIEHTPQQIVRAIEQALELA